MIVGIRREDKNEWERRVPLTPEDVAQLAAAHALRFQVQPSPIRVFPESAYAASGAEIREDLSTCDLILGVKEIPIPLLLPHKAYIFFSHTIKGQPRNMPMLQRLLDLGCTLLDYELIADDAGRRLVFFGRFAGLAGMIDTLHALGQRLTWEGIPNPFADVRMAHGYADLAEARRTIAQVGTAIRSQGLDPRLTPLVFGVAGYGSVSGGAQEILDLLPVETIAPREVLTLRNRPDLSPRRVYKVVFKEEHTVRPRDPRGVFDLQDYREQPGKYVGVFDQYLPHLNVLVNGVLWTKKCPRLVTKDSVRKLFAGQGQPHLRVIGDISCDIEGSIEFTVKETDPAHPCFVYDAESDAVRDGYTGRGPVVMAVDNLPCELPVEASRFFSEHLRGFVTELAHADLQAPFEQMGLPPALRRAVIAAHGALVPDFAHLSEALREASAH